MKIQCVWEHNGDDTLLYAVNAIGAFARGASKEEALQKMPREVAAWSAWAGRNAAPPFAIEIIQEKPSALNIRDADSDVLFDTEKTALTLSEYESLKALAMKSAQDFLALYEAFPDKNRSVLPPRETFYGAVPRTAEEMYQHTRNVNDYYWSEIGVDAGNEGTIAESRARGFSLLEKQEGFLKNRVFDGSFGEQWTLSKVIRRFLWHDRIHARAMYRMGVRTFGAGQVPNVFRFDVDSAAINSHDPSLPGP